MATTASPTRAALDAFGVVGEVRRLDGGQGESFASDSAVLKPAWDTEVAVWSADVLAGLPEDGFRVPRPIRGSDGTWVVDGWTACERVVGEPMTWGSPWPVAAETCRRFHAALSDVPRPDFLDRRDDVFAVAERAAWGEREASIPPPLDVAVDRLREHMRPVDLPRQIVHGDFAGNLLVADGLFPAVIDLSPQWRPAGYAVAQTVVDAQLWYGADLSLLSTAHAVPDADQLLARALAFRLIIDGLLLDERSAAARWEPTQIEWDLARAEPLIRYLERDAVPGV